MAKNDFYACLSDTIEPRKFNNDTKGIKSFFSHLKKHDFQKDNTLLGVESTASYHFKLCIETSERDYKINVINPLIVKKRNQTNLRRVKNDKKDSRLIRFCLIGGAGYEFDNDPDAIILKSLIRQRDSLVCSKLKLMRQQDDIRLKEKCLKQEINPIYAEIINRVHQSGTSVNGKGYISKRGNKILRTRLFNAASVAVQHDNMFKTFFQKKKDEGKPYRVALVATMRKITHVIHAVRTRGTPFVK